MCGQTQTDHSGFWNLVTGFFEIFWIFFIFWLASHMAGIQGVFCSPLLGKYFARRRWPVWQRLMSEADSVAASLFWASLGFWWGDPPGPQSWLTASEPCADITIVRRRFDPTRPIKRSWITQKKQNNPVFFCQKCLRYSIYETGAGAGRTRCCSVIPYIQPVNFKGHVMQCFQALYRFSCLAQISALAVKDYGCHLSDFGGVLREFKFCSMCFITHNKIK